MIKVLIVDDHVLLAESLKYMMQQEKDLIEVVGLAAGGNEAVTKCRLLSPDVVLMDIKMADRDGFSAAAEIKEQSPETKIILLTTFENREHVWNAAVVGVDGYILKDVRPKSLIMAIQCVCSGFTVLQSSVSRLLQQELVRLYEKNRGFGNEPLKTDERDIVRLIAYGKSNREIAEILNYSEGTIKNKVSRILETLGLKDRTQIVVYALKNDLI